MDKDKILDYVRKTPANTNPNVLKTMLDDSGSEMNPGYSCTETTTLLTNESVTTITTNTNINSGALAYSTPIDADTIKVTFNGTEYVCDATRATHGKGYGAPIGEDGPDFSEYPFQIASGLGNMLFTESAGTYQIKIETVEEVVETTPCFEKAVNSVIGGSGGSGGGGTEPLIVRPQSFVREEAEGSRTATLTFDKTWQEVHDAIANGTPCYAGVFPIGGDTLDKVTSVEELNNKPTMIPIYAAYIDPDSGKYCISILLDSGGFDEQTSPNTLLVNYDGIAK